MSERSPRTALARSRRHRLLFALTFGTMLLLLTLLGGVATVRLYIWARGWTANCYAASLDLFQPHPTRGYDLKPNFRLRSGTFVTSTNRLGLRGPEVDIEPDDDTIRIAMAGGSSAFGYLVDDGQEAARVLEDELREEDLPVEVVNGAVPGYNLYQSRTRWLDRIAPLEPDYLVLYLGYNDLAYICVDDPQRERFRVLPVAPWHERLLGKSALYCLVKYRLLRPDTTVLPANRPGSERTEAGCAQFRKNLDAMLAAARSVGAEMIVCSQCMAAHPDAPSEVQRLVAEDPDEIEPMIESSRWVRDTLRDFAAENDLLFIDAYRKIRPTPENLGDDIHLTVTGERRLGQLLAERIGPRLPDQE